MSIFAIPMMYIFPGALQGAVTAPPSKSFSIRALVADYLAGGGSVLHNLSDCEDVQVAQKAFAKISSANISLVDCGESALTLHLLAAAVALDARSVSLTAQGTLRQRPLNSLVNALEAFGVSCSVPELGFPLRVTGPLRAGSGVLDGRLGSQAVSGLLMALPLLKGNSEILLRHPVSLPYIDLTLDVMHKFGVVVEAQPDIQSGLFRYLIPGSQSYQPFEVTVPRDWSGAAALMAAAAVSSAKYGGEGCMVKGLGTPHFAAPDSVIIKVLHSAGVLCTPIGTDWNISVPKGLTPFVFDLTHAPDLAPPLAVLAAYTPGVSVLQNVHRLKAKESSRGDVLQQVLKQLGVKTILERDELKVYGGGSVRLPAGEVIESRNDHRIAMAMAIAAVGADTPICLSGASCVAKTYPRFWDDFASLSCC